jgi:hypothetical protein
VRSHRSHQRRLSRRRCPPLDLVDRHQVLKPLRPLHVAPVRDGKAHPASSRHEGTHARAVGRGRQARGQAPSRHRTRPHEPNAGDAGRTCEGPRRRASRPVCREVARGWLFTGTARAQSTPPQLDQRPRGRDAGPRTSAADPRREEPRAPFCGPGGGDVGWGQQAQNSDL